MASFIQPIVAMIGVTAAVWVVMYVKRLSYIGKHKIDPATIDTPDKLIALLPDNIHLPSNNFKNLFEMPVLFYTLCLSFAILRNQGIDYTDSWILKMAWAYVILRLLHSIVQSTYNDVNHRFTLYFLSSVIIWIMAVKLAIVVFR